MLYMKEMRANVVAECTLKESAAINQILGRRVGRAVYRYADLGLSFFFSPSLSLLIELNRGEIIVYVMFSEEAARLAEKVKRFLPFIDSLYKLVVIIVLMIAQANYFPFPPKAPHPPLSVFQQHRHRLPV